jgi:hypothetical protein
MSQLGLRLHKSGSEPINSYLSASLGIIKLNYAKVAEYPVSDSIYICGPDKDTIGAV